MRWRMIRIIAVREWRAALAARWFWAYAGVVALVGAALLWMASGMMPGGLPAEVAGGRVILATVNLLALLVPLMGLTAGAQCLARERDRQTIGYLLAQPLTRTEVLLGKLLGNGLALGAALGSAMAVMLLVQTVSGVPLPAVLLVEVVGLAWLLSLAALALGAAIGAGAAGLVATQGATLGAWLLMILLGDLGLMGLLMLRQLPTKVLLVLTFLNPVHQFRVAAVALFRPSLEVLGPVGLYARDRLGGALVPVLLISLLVWTFGAVLVALERFRTSRVVS
jgi:Cu-processing system permease protein